MLWVPYSFDIYVLLFKKKELHTVAYRRATTALMHIPTWLCYCYYFFMKYIFHCTALRIFPSFSLFFCLFWDVKNFHNTFVFSLCKTNHSTNKRLFTFQKCFALIFTMGNSYLIRVYLFYCCLFFWRVNVPILRGIIVHEQNETHTHTHFDKSTDITLFALFQFYPQFHIETKLRREDHLINPFIFIHLISSTTGTEEFPKKSVVNRVASQLQKALCEKGIAFLVNHGISEDKVCILEVCAHINNSGFETQVNLNDKSPIVAWFISVENGLVAFGRFL